MGTCRLENPSLRPVPRQKLEILSKKTKNKKTSCKKGLGAWLKWKNTCLASMRP
jgi:hypothetical protein